MSAYLSIEDLIRKVPAVANRQPHPYLSNRFAPVATIDLVEKLMSEGFMPTAAMGPMADSSYGFHFVRMAIPGAQMLAVGDAVPELVLSNAANGSAAFRISLGIFRMICTNGMVAGNTFQSFIVDHKQDAPVLALKAADSAVHELDKLAAWADKMSSLRTGPEWRSTYARRAAAIRWAGPNGTVDPMGVEDPSALLDARRADDHGDSVWHVYNVVQENIIRGGRVTTVGATGRRTMSRALSSSAADFHINTRLFDLTSEMALQLAA